MKIVYVSNLCSTNVFNECFEKSNRSIGQQAQKYHKLIAEGLVKNNNVEVSTVTSIPTTYNSSVDKFVKYNSEKENDVIYNYLPTINLPIVKNICTIISSFNKVRKLCKKDKDVVVICDVLNISVSLGALIASKLSNGINVGIVTDLPQFINKKNRGISVKINNYLINNFSSYVFLTEDMKNVVNCKDKKYVVIEGQVDKYMSKMNNRLRDKYEKKICIYSGGLQKVYGIETLVEGFIKANIEDAELHIYGSGDFEEELIEICNTNERVKYWGVQPNKKVVKEQIKASLLINPRPTNEEYTKYSYPSKNMEYMVSGTPTLTTKLPGMPKEYYKYVYLIEDETVEGISNILKDILNRPKEELYNKGMEAKKFVLNYKNNIIQAKKILDMIDRKAI